MTRLIAYFVSWFDNRHGHPRKVLGAAAIGMVIAIASVFQLSLKRPCTKVEILAILIGVPLIFGVAGAILAFRDGQNG